MIPFVIQSIEDIIKAATPEQKIVWQQIRLIAGESAAVRQMYYQGTTAGSEFLTYQANRIYLAYDISFYPGSGGVNAAACTVQFFDENNVSDMLMTNYSAMWDATAAATRYAHNMVKEKNIYFSRIIATNYTGMKFNGFRIN